MHRLYNTVLTIIAQDLHIKLPHPPYSVPVPYIPVGNPRSFNITLYSGGFSDRVLRPVVFSNQSSFCPTGAFLFHSCLCQTASRSKSLSGEPTTGSRSGTEGEQIKHHDSISQLNLCMLLLATDGLFLHISAAFRSKQASCLVE